MTLNPEEQAAFEALEIRIKAILPDEYKDSYDDVQPISMGSAGLKYGRDGKVAWDDIWDTFCDLAMAGGPPHKGSLLEPGTHAAIEAQPERYREVVEEIRRGITLVADLATKLAPLPGWVRVKCESEVMAQWLARAIVMENVSARCEGKMLDLPAGPDYRIEKEIKNVITVIAKTTHYWDGHLWSREKKDMANLFAKMKPELPPIEPPIPGADNPTLRDAVAVAIHTATGLRASAGHTGGWLGVDCKNVRAAIWIMRALVASNVFARREGTEVFVPINPASDPDGRFIARQVVRTHNFAAAHGVL